MTVSCVLCTLSRLIILSQVIIDEILTRELEVVGAKRIRMAKLTAEKLYGIHKGCTIIFVLT